MGDGTARPLDALAAQLIERRFRAAVYGDTLLVCPPSSVREQVIACDGLWFRWGGATGPVVGAVRDVPAAADQAARVLRRAARWP